MKIYAGIVLYNPDEKRLLDNVHAIENQVDGIIFFDNGSKNIDIIQHSIFPHDNFYLIKENSNLGIAYALNKIAIAAMKEKATWLVTLDQDTVVNKDLIKNYMKFINLPKVGQLTCAYKDRNSGKIYDKLPEYKKYMEVSECITSGALLKLSVLKEIGGFDNKLFIDSVDFDLCYQMKELGFKTYLINSVGILHEIGHIKKVHFFNKTIDIYNQTPMRHYYRTRNDFIMARRYTFTKSVPRTLYLQLREWGKVLLYEDKKLTKTKSMISGTISGLSINIERKNFIN